MTERNDDLSAGNQPESVAAVLKVFAILQGLSERSETGISELSQRLAMPKATIYRFLQTMKTLGYVRQTSAGDGYGLSMKVFELGTKALQYPDLIDAAKHQMEFLSEKTSETIHLGMLIDSEIIYVHKVDSRHLLGMYSRIGRRAPLYCTAIGKVLMAWEDPDIRNALLANVQFKVFQKNTIVDQDEYLNELALSKARGYAVDKEEFDDHIRCLAVPVFDRMHHVIAGISVSFPSFRYEENREDEIVGHLHYAARTISSELGCIVYL